MTARMLRLDPRSTSGEPPADCVAAGAGSSAAMLACEDEAVPAVALAREAGERGGTAPAVYNAANEECVEAFRAGRLRFVDIIPTVAAVLAAHDVRSGEHLTVDDVLAADAWARAEASALIAQKQAQKDTPA